jgi:prepilin-type N-terminal cleavage/methylation domain-containing protein
LTTSDIGQIMPALRSPDSVAGFTLTELIMVLAVVAVISAIAVSRMSNDPLLVATQAEQLATDIRYVQSLAMTQAATTPAQSRYRINFVSASTYTFTRADGTAVPHPVTGSTAATALSSGVTMTLPPTGLFGFDGRGIPYTDAAVSVPLGATATVTLTKNAATRTVTVAPETGLVRVP